MASGSDRLKGQAARVKTYGSGSTGGPWAPSGPMGGPSQSTNIPAWQTGARGKGNVSASQLHPSVCKVMSGNPSSGIKSAPMTTHVPDGAIQDSRKVNSSGGVVRGRSERRDSPNAKAGRY
jgi:hypothetical protein